MKSKFRIQRWMAVLLCVAVVIVFFSYKKQNNFRKASGPALEPQFIIGMSIKGLHSPFMMGLVQGTQNKSKELGMKLIVSECNGDLQIQANQLQDFVMQDVDAILVEPLDANALNTVLIEVEEAGIPVFCIDTSANAENVMCWIGSDSIEMGRQAAQYIVDRLYERYGEYKGNVVDLMATLATTSGMNRTKGFSEVIEQYPDIHIVTRQNGGLELDVAMDVMTDILQSNQQIDAVWCSGDTNAQGAILAMEQAGRLYPTENPNHIILVSADGAPESLEAIRNGIIDACISQNPIGMGYTAIQLIYAYLNYGRIPEKDFFAYPLFTITLDNIDSTMLKEYGIWADEIEDHLYINK